MDLFSFLRKKKNPSHLSPVDSLTVSLMFIKVDTLFYLNINYFSLFVYMCGTYCSADYLKNVSELLAYFV